MQMKHSSLQLGVFSHRMCYLCHHRQMPSLLDVLLQQMPLFQEVCFRRKLTSVSVCYRARFCVLPVHGVWYYIYTGTYEYQVIPVAVTLH